MKRQRVGAALAALAGAALVVGVGVGAAGGRPTDGAAPPRVDTRSALVQLKGEPLATYEKTRPPHGKKIDFSSETVKSYRAQLAALRNEFKRWLHRNARSARVTGEFDIALNAVAVELNGTSLSTIQAAPMVQRAEYEGIYTPAAHGFDPDLSLIDAFAAWGGATHAAGAATAGAGVKVAIIDTGIDTRHPCFGSGSTNGGTNAKVLDAAVYYNKNVVAGFTPADLNGHGSHVAGTVACNFNTAATVNGVPIPYGVSGVAPAAKLGNFNVFPGTVGSARSEDILDALEDALEKGYDVANMSLGGGSAGIQDLLSIGVDNADKAGMVVAVAAGNSGPGLNTVESPGIAPRALTAGAASVGHFVGAPLTVGAATHNLATGDFATVASDLTATLDAVTDSAGPGGLSTACAALPGGSLTGKIAVVSRGGCTFSTKIRNAQNAGAAAVVVVNNVQGDPIAMGQDGTPNQPTVPAYMVGLGSRAALIAADGSSATIDSDLSYFLTGNDDFMAGFSSQGPTDVDFRVKPDVVAPGVNVLSAQPDNKWAFFQGTSMATPHLAGAAAFLKSKFPSWSAAQIRSAIVNTAEEGVLKRFDTGAPTANVNVVGAGRLNLDSALNAAVLLNPVSVSFGGVPSGAGRTDTRTVKLTNLGAPGSFSA
ncbi:MAG TPA: S8 family serine peptidase, partial [Gaiellaceae bacterium]|nr:S8 family serine peptidase [Gaiellaceae bacterium]